MCSCTFLRTTCPCFWHCSCLNRFCKSQILLPVVSSSGIHPSVHCSHIKYPITNRNWCSPRLTLKNSSYLGPMQTHVSWGARARNKLMVVREFKTPQRAVGTWNGSWGNLYRCAKCRENLFDPGSVPFSKCHFGSTQVRQFFWLCLQERFLSISWWISCIGYRSHVGLVHWFLVIPNRE